MRSHPARVPPGAKCLVRQVASPRCSSHFPLPSRQRAPQPTTSTRDLPGGCWGVDLSSITEAASEAPRGPRVNSAVPTDRILGCHESKPTRTQPSLASSRRTDSTTTSGWNSTPPLDRYHHWSRRRPTRGYHPSSMTMMAWRVESDSGELFLCRINGHRMGPVVVGGDARGQLVAGRVLEGTGMRCIRPARSNNS